MLVPAMPVYWPATSRHYTGTTTVRECSIAVAISRSSHAQQDIRAVNAVVNLCALVNGGQHLFFLYERWFVILFCIAVGRVLLQRFRKKAVPLFLGAVQGYADVRHRVSLPGLPIEQVLVVVHLCWLRRDGRWQLCFLSAR